MLDHSQPRQSFEQADHQGASPPDNATIPWLVCRCLDVKKVLARDKKSRRSLKTYSQSVLA